MPERFFVDQLIRSDLVKLCGQEAAHIVKVMRLGVGDKVTLFDGSGCESIGRILTIARDQVSLRILASRTVSREIDFQLTVAAALPKGERQRFLVEKLTELGVTCFVPLVTARGTVKPGLQNVKRLRRSVIEASKQCGRTMLMEVTEPLTLSEVSRALPADQLNLLCEPSPGNAAISGFRQARVFVAVGPEGGWSEHELGTADEHRLARVSLGPRILRTETAAICAAAQLVAVRIRDAD